MKDACDGDEGLLAAVSGLLREHDRADNPVDKPLAAPFLPTPHLEERSSDGTDSQFPLGTMIGPYNLREQVGEGCFGFMFVADQLQPVRRRVALKVIIRKEEPPRPSRHLMIENCQP